MADDKDGQAVAADNKPAGFGVVKVIVLVIVGLVLIAATVIGTLYFLGVFGGGEELAKPAAEQEQSAALPSAIYYPIKPPFIINYQVRGRQRFLQVSVTVMTRESDAMDAVKMHLPLIKSRLNLLFGGESYEELHTAEGKELLRQKALAEIQDILQEEIGKPGIEQVLFEDFIMQ